MTEPIFAACMRVRDCPVPHVPSKQVRCATCMETVWLSPGTEKTAGAGATILCIPCAVEQLAKSPNEAVMGPSDAQKAELIAYCRDEPHALNRLLKFQDGEAIKSWLLRKKRLARWRRGIAVWLRDRYRAWDRVTGPRGD